MASNKSTALLLSVLLVSSLAISANAQDLCVGVDLNAMLTCQISSLLGILLDPVNCCAYLSLNVNIPCLCQCASKGLLGGLGLLSLDASVALILGKCSVPYTPPLKCPY